MLTKYLDEAGSDSPTRSLMPCGELDGVLAADVRQRIEEALVSGMRRVIIDLTGVSYMETSALAMLMDENARMKRFGASLLVVIPLDSRVRLLFSITRMDRILRVLGTREEALAA
jgi:anti-sigma B factor antagonist